MELTITFQFVDSDGDLHIYRNPVNGKNIILSAQDVANLKMAEKNQDGDAVVRLADADEKLGDLAPDMVSIMGGLNLLKEEVSGVYRKLHAISNVTSGVAAPVARPEPATLPRQAEAAKAAPERPQAEPAASGPARAPLDPAPPAEQTEPVVEEEGIDWEGLGLKEGTGENLPFLVNDQAGPDGSWIDPDTLRKYSDAWPTIEDPAKLGVLVRRVAGCDINYLRKFKDGLNHEFRAAIVNFILSKDGERTGFVPAELADFMEYTGKDQGAMVGDLGYKDNRRDARIPPDFDEEKAARLSAGSRRPNFIDLAEAEKQAESMAKQARSQMT